VIAERDSLAFNLGAGLDLDLAQVEAALRGEPATLPAAIAAYRGDFLEGFSLNDTPEFENWAGLQREVWHRRLASVFDRLSQTQAERGEQIAAIETATRWVGHDPLNEAAHRRLMELHFAHGNRSAALQAYEAGREILKRELDTEPEPETQALAERIRTAQIHSREPQKRAAPHGDAPFVGRSAEHTALVKTFYDVRRYQTRLITLEGEPGIGKTRLAKEFLRWAGAQGAVALEGRAFETGSRVPYQPVVEALRSAPIHSAALTPVWWAELSRLMPELHDRYPDLPSPLMLGEAEAQTRLFESVFRLVQALADNAPVVVLIDDVHWADAASLDLLRYGLRRWNAAALPVLVLFTLRTEDLAASPSLAEWLAGLARDVSLARLRLGPLTPDETLALANAMIAPDDQRLNASALFAATGGHPLFIVETIRARGASPGLPSGVRDLIRSRLSRLTAQALNVCAAAAMLGGPFDFEALCRVADVSESEGLSSLDDLLARGLLREANGRYEFVHDQIREVIEADLSEARRRVLHRRALEALPSAPAAELVRHALAANFPDQVFDLSLAAGDDALRVFAVRDAILHYERALAIKATPQLYSQLGRAYELTGEAGRAQSVYEAMLTEARASQYPRLECAALNRLALLACPRPGHYWSRR
jgi:tetratricopeptide (TPR) repeat protein